MLKTLTLQEANGLLPLLKEHRFRMSAMLLHLQKLHKHLEQKYARQLLINPKSINILLVEKKTRSKKHQGIMQEIKEIEDLIGNEIDSLMRFGAVVKSLYPLHIDFLSIRNHEPVFLCWHGEENAIKHWHYLDASTPFRQIIGQENCFGPHMVH